MPTATGHCTFCDIIRGAGEVSLCYEAADALAFMDIQPVNAGHVLVVPRAHYESLADVPPQLAMHLFDISMRLAGVVRQVTGCEGLNIVVNSGAAAGQDVFHYHVHVIPRREHDGFDIPLPFGGSAMPDRTLLDALAAQIISAFRDPMRTGNGEGGAAGSDSTRRERRTTSPRAGRRAESAERVHALATFSETPQSAYRDDVDDAAPVRRWTAPWEGAHGELRRAD